MTKYLLLVVLSITVSCGGSTGDGDNSDGVDANDHRIFVSSVFSTGKFSSGPGNTILGIIAADDLCDNLARNANLIRSYKAILSDSTVDAVSRIFISGSIYTVAGTDSTLIAETASDLWNASVTPLKNDIDRDETGTFITDNSLVWTGTSFSGTKNTVNCNDWKEDTLGDGSDQFKGSVGQLGRIDGFWIDNTTESTCNQNRRIYCISQ